LRERFAARRPQTSDQIVIVSGIQQALDLLARVLLKRGDAVWMEDPGYFGASIAFTIAGAKVVGVPVDEEGLSVSAGKKLSPHAKGVYLTPAHQFPLGVTMSLERRMALLNWASRTGAFVIEDDYDSEYRFQGQPVPALQTWMKIQTSFSSDHSVRRCSHRYAWATSFCLRLS
jgi:GntR family transcriptional regulator/MocR family aminotransferase